MSTADQWVFVTAAYVVTAIGTITLLLTSWRAMRRAEARTAALSKGDS